MAHHRELACPAGSSWPPWTSRPASKQCPLSGIGAKPGCIELQCCLERIESAQHPADRAGHPTDSCRLCACSLLRCCAEHSLWDTADRGKGHSQMSEGTSCGWQIASSFLKNAPALPTMSASPLRDTRRLTEMSLPPMFLPSSAYMASSASLVSTNSTKPKPLGRLQAPGAMESPDSVFSVKARDGFSHGATASPSTHCWCNRDPCMAIWCRCSSYCVGLPQDAVDVCKAGSQ